MKPRAKGRWYLAAIVVVAISAVSLGTALAHKVRSPVTINLQIKDIDATTSQFSGKVGSRVLRRCAIGRLVTVTSATGLNAQGVTNFNGDYSVVGPKQAQGLDITATVGRKVLRKNRRHKHVCLPASQTHKAPK